LVRLRLLVGDADWGWQSWNMYSRTPLLSNPERYAHTVTMLVVRDPDFATARGHETASYIFSDEQGRDMPDSPRNLRSIHARDLSSMLEVCSSLEAFTWESPIPPPDGLCEVCV
jgi:hypothetical protein